MNNDLTLALSHLQAAQGILSSLATDLAVDAAAGGPPRGFDIDDLYGSDFLLGRVTSMMLQTEKVITALEEETQ